MKLKRREERSLCADLLKVVWKDGSGRKRKETAALEDISSHGACIQTEVPIPEDTPLSILYPNGRYHGRVRYCRFDRTGYFVGIEFDKGYRWSSRQYVPSHLLTLPNLRGGDEGKSRVTEARNARRRSE